MASTYSANLKIELQATGENSGTWGTITNTNLGTALEQAIVGYGNPNYASDANLTLTYTDTNAAQAARALVLNVTSGVSLTGTRELVVPTIQKQYIVQNNTTGAQSITVKTSAGTGITVPNGRKAHLYVDGTNVIYMDDYVDINGGAIDGTPIGANSASTGAFTTLSASGNITVSGGTANGVLYLNGSKVATSGSALTFDGDALTIGSATAPRLRANMSGAQATRFAIQNSTANGNSRIHVYPNGTGSISAITFRNNSDPDAVNFNGFDIACVSTTDCRITSQAAGSNSQLPLTFYIGSSEVARFDTSGNLGIGTASPGGKFNVDFGNYVGVGARFQYNSSNIPLCINALNNSGDAYLSWNAAAKSGSNTSTYVITSGATKIEGGGSQFIFYNAPSGTAGTDITFTERLRLDSSGNLGLGVTPSAWTSNIKALEGASGGALSFYAAGGFPGTFITSNAYSDGTNWIAKVTDQACLYTLEGTTGKHIWSVAASNTTAGNAITFTQAMTLDSSGNLMVGATSAVGRFTLQDTGTTTEITLRSSGGVGNNNRARIIGGYESGGSDYGGYLAFNTTSTSNANTERARITADGNVGIGTTSPGARLDAYTSNNSSSAYQLSLRNGTGNNNVSAGLVFGFNSTAADPDYLAGIYGLITNRTTRAADLVFSTAATGTLTERMRIDSAGKITDQYGNIRAIPQSGSDKTTSYTLATTDVGRFIGVGSGGSITVPDATFATGDVVSIFNNTTGNVTLTMTITTAYIGGTNTDKATITLATRGVATILFISGTVCVVNGNVS